MPYNDIQAVVLWLAYRNKAQSKRVETIWIFEKDSSKLFDETPIYEGAIIEYLHKVKVSASSQSLAE